MLNKADLQSWIEISREAFEHNLDLLTQHAKADGKDCLLMVKSNAYGHGLVTIAELAEQKGVKALGITDISDAIALRKAQVKLPILLFTEPLRSSLPLVQKYEVSLVIGSLHALTQLRKEHFDTIPIHVKINCGLNRYGFDQEDLPAVHAMLQKNDCKPAGIAAHYSNATDPIVTQREFNKFLLAKKYFNKKGISFDYIHSSNSAATIWFHEKETNLVRLGLAAYGLQPDTKRTVELKPVLSWSARLTSLREVQLGETIGYGSSFVANKKMLLGVVPVGYGDGLRRSPHRQQYFAWNGHKVPIVGNIMMNHCLVDVSSVPEIQVGAEIKIIGTSGKLSITAETIAQQTGTINEEVITALSSRIPRFVV